MPMLLTRRIELNRLNRPICSVRSSSLHTQKGVCLTIPAAVPETPGRALTLSTTLATCFILDDPRSASAILNNDEGILGEGHTDELGTFFGPDPHILQVALGVTEVAQLLQALLAIVHKVGEKSGIHHGPMVGHLLMVLD